MRGYDGKPSFWQHPDSTDPERARRALWGAAALLGLALLLFAMCLGMGCVQAPEETPYAEADFDFGAFAKRVEDVEQHIGEVEGMAAANAENIQQIRDISPQAGRDAFTIVEKGGAWAVVAVVAVVLLAWVRHASIKAKCEQAKAGRYREQRDGLAGRMAANGERVRGSSER